MKSEVEVTSTTMAETVELLRSKEFREAYEKAPAIQRLAFDWRLKWLSSAHPHQILPSGDWWSVWLLLAGRGAGKTRVAAEQVGWWAWTTPNSRWLVSAPTSSDVRSTCYEGDSGLLNVIPEKLIADYNKSYHEIKLILGEEGKDGPDRVQMRNTFLYPDRRGACRPRLPRRGSGCGPLVRLGLPAWRRVRGRA